MSAPTIPDGPWKGKPWESWFANFKAETGAVDPSPFDARSAFYPHPTMTQWDATVAVNPRGHGIMQGSCWASRQCADLVAFVFGGFVVDGRPNFAGGASYDQPQFLVRMTPTNSTNPDTWVDVNPGEIADRFINQAGPAGRSAEYLNWWLEHVTAA